MLQIVAVLKERNEMLYHFGMVCMVAGDAALNGKPQIRRLGSDIDNTGYYRK